jgi:RNA polymerase sigma-70 factor (ECF subfamily)
MTSAELPPLSAALVGALQPPLLEQARAADDLEPRLERIVATAREAWPALALTDVAFVGYLAGRLSPDIELATALAELRAADLFLACGCARGDAAAMTAFETGYFNEIRHGYGRLKPSGASLEDVEQLLRLKLFVADGDRPAKISSYSGRGDLRSWLRVIVVRALVDLGRDGRRRGPELAVEPDELFALPSPDEDPELAYLKEHYRQEFRAAFFAALAGRTPRERNLLRQRFVHGLTVDQIAPLYRVHRATAARWVGKARSDLLAGTRRELRARLRVGRSELESIMRLIQSQLDVSLSRVLAAEGEEEGSEPPADS